MTGRSPQVILPGGDPAAAARRPVSWPYVLAALTAAMALGYLAVWARRYGLDLRVYRDSVHAWAAGTDPYRTRFTQGHLRFTYPPFALPVLSPLSWAPLPVTQWLLWATSIAAAAGSVVLVVRDRCVAVTPRLWCEAVAWSCVSVVVLEPVRSGIDFGQIEFILMLVVVADLLLVPPPWRGIGVGIAGAVKVTPLAFVVVLAASRDMKSAARALVSFLACTGLSWLCWPHLSALYWFHELGRPGRVGRPGYGGNQSWYAILHRPPFPAGGSVVAWLLLSLGTLAVSAFVAWRCASRGQRAFAIVAVALAIQLVSPISWTHHWIWVLLIPPMLVACRGAGMARPVQLALWGIVAVTVAAPYWWFSRGIPADVLGAVLPLWTCAVLMIWAGCERTVRSYAAPPG